MVDYEHPSNPSTEWFYENLREKNDKEFLLGRTLTGPHLDKHTPRTTPSPTLRRPHSSKSLTTHTLPETEPAKPPKPRKSEPLLDSPMLPKLLLNSRLPSTSPPSQLPSKPTKWPSKCTPQVSSPPDAEPTLTTVSSPSDMVPSTDKTTSSSRTHGVHHGETKDTSESEPTTFAVSSKLPHTHTSDQQIKPFHDGFYQIDNNNFLTYIKY